MRIQTTVPVTRYVPVTKADDELPGGDARGLWVGTAGTANLMDEDGNVRANVPLKEGLFPCVVRQVRIGGTATDIWALY